MSEGSTDPAVALDGALAPLRRLVGFARARPKEVRYFEVNARRWLDRARTAAAAASVGSEVDALAAPLDGLDAADPATRELRIDEIYQALTRIDALLGLPLPPLRPSPLRSAPRPPAAPPQKVQAPPARSPVEHPSPRTTSLEARFHDLGVPGTLCAILSAAGLEVVGDLASLAPEAEEILQPVHGAGREIPPGRVAVGGRVRRRWSVLSPDGTRVDHAILHGAGRLDARWGPDVPAALRDAWLADLTPDARVILAGSWTSEGVLVDAEPVTGDDRHVVHLPIYRGVDARFVRAAVGRMSPSLLRVRDPVPADVLARASLGSLGEALVDAHLRGSARPAARRRLAFDEALLVQLGLGYARFQAARTGIAHPLQHTLVARLSTGSGLDPLDDALAAAFEDIKRDLRRALPMMRLLDGLPGPERGTLAFLAAILVAESRSQVLVISPDAASADQRLALFEPVLREAGLVGRAFAGELGKPARDAIRRGETHILCGGPELLDQGIEFRRLGLVIVFERPPYGEVVRRIAEGRVGRPDLLVIPWTAVDPATVAGAWPQLDVTRVPGPALAQPEIEIFPASRRTEAYARAAAAVRAQRQALVAFPVVDGVDAVDLRDAARVVRALEAEAFGGMRVALFHGSMSRDDRARVYDDFRHHRLDVLVTTAPLEEGPSAPAVSAVVVDHAEDESPLRIRRLLASLLGRDPWMGLVVPDAPSPALVAALEALRKPDPGNHEVFRPADARLDPPRPAWRWIDLDAPQEWWAGRSAAQAILADDPGLRRNTGSSDLARWARDRWPDWFPAPLESEVATAEDDDAESDEEAGWPCPIPEGAPTAGERRRRRRKRKRR
jgi:RecG-like helicase